MYRNQQQKQRGFPIRQVAIGYMIAIIFAEFLLLYVSSFGGIFMHSAIVMSLIFWSSTFEESDYSRTLSALTFIPILRIIGLISPVRGFSTSAQELALSISLLTVAFIYLTSHGLILKDIGVKQKSTMTQFSMGIAGVGMGLLMGLLNPQPIPTDYMIPVLLTFFTVFVEVLLFYGIVLHTSVRTFGKFEGVVFTAVYYTLLFAYLPYPIVGVQFVIHILFGLAVVKTHNLTGVFIAHSVSRIVYTFFVPILLVLLANL